VEHNSRAVINRYLGYWDANPATLIPLSPKDSAPLYVEMMGGAKPIINKGKALFNEGKYHHAAEILNKLVYAEPANIEARELLADVFEQLGYQQESPSVRNSFLAGAYELRNGIPTGAAAKSTGPDMIRAMSTDLFLDFMAIRLNSKKAEGKHFTINLITPDNGEKYAVELSNATLTNIEGFLAKNPDLTITVNRSDLEKVMMGAGTLEQLFSDGTAKFEGNIQILADLKGMLDQFELLFEILPGTAPKSMEQKQRDALEQDLPAVWGAE
jgi:alkyl sulfatase BDS1-like metallo-beta-lactamase superfamily hydrolase